MSIVMLTFAPLFAGLLKELLKSDRFVSILMDNSKPEEESENSDLLEGENPLPLILKKVIDEVVLQRATYDFLTHYPLFWGELLVDARVW